MIRSLPRRVVMASASEMLPSTVSWQVSDTFHGRFQISKNRFQTGSIHCRRNASEMISVGHQSTFSPLILEPFNGEFPDTVSESIVE